MKEIHLIDRFCEFLDKNRYEYKQELRKKSYIGDGFADIVIKNNGYLISVEAKTSFSENVILQAIYNRNKFPFNYILIPQAKNAEKKKECRKRGIGIIIPEDEGFVVIQKPTHFIFLYIWKIYNNKYYYYVLRNWVQNRAGRNLRKNELPKGHDNLTPDYKWVGKESDPLKMDTDWKALGFRIYPKLRECSLGYTRNKKLDKWI